MNRSLTAAARGPGDAGKPESRAELGGFLSPPPSIHPAREGGPRPPGPVLRGSCGTARRPTLTAARAAARHSAPCLRRPGRAALPFRFREPARRDRPSGCRHARALALSHGPPSPAPLRVPELRWEPPRAERPESARSSELRPAYLHQNLPVPPRPCPGGSRAAPHPP